MVNLTPPSNLRGTELAKWCNDAILEATAERKRSGLDWKVWAEERIKEHDKAVMDAKLELGVGGKAVFLPFQGEAGWWLMHAIRLVHFSQAIHKTVCCKRGQECLFPSADAFDYDWADVVPDELRAGTNRRHSVSAIQWPEIVARYPDSVPVGTGEISHTQELFPYHLESRIPIRPLKVRGLKVDVCVGVRNRAFLPEKNYPHWPYIASRLREKGLTFAVIGNRQTSVPLEGQTCISGDYGDWDSAVELLQNCKVFIGTDSGGAHLSSVANGCPMIVQEVPNTAACTTRNFISRMAATTNYPVTHLPADRWNDPDAFLSEVAKLI
jgi:hypothetical protein